MVNLLLEFQGWAYPFKKQDTRIVQVSRQVQETVGSALDLKQAGSRPARAVEGGLARTQNMGPPSPRGTVNLIHNTAEFSVWTAKIFLASTAPAMKDDSQSKL